MADKEHNDFVEDPELTSMLKHLDIEDRGVGGGRGGKGKRGGRDGGGGGRPQDRATQISKALSQLLRHKAEEAGLPLDGEGFARLDQVMKWNRLRSLQATLAEIQAEVADNAKQRFSMKPNPALKTTPDPSSTEPSDWVIRANQGHTIVMDSAALHTPITIEAGNIPEVVVHGTFFVFYQLILDSGGLKRMDRNHIHFSPGLPEERAGVVSGMRGDAELLIYVDVRKSLDDGVVWWLSENGVVLTEGDASGVLGTKYWTKVVGRRNEVGVLWEDGRMVGELPVVLRNRRAPRGKEPKPMGENRDKRNVDSRGGKGRGRGRGKGVGKDLRSEAEI